ncbi:MAG: L-threonylcarbamoyladenylate synthase [Bacteroidales bacterium]|nr:L-threonylcarbamoyladenylate synthase [Bacteroidales bacterium]
MITVDEAINIGAQYIKEGKIVAFPTETVYGLGANAFNPTAVAKIYELKERPSFDPLIVHIATMTDLEKLILEKDLRIFKLAEKFWPGPLTIVTKKNTSVPNIVTAGLDPIGIRMPSNPIALKLISTAGVPIAAPSANKFGQLSPTSAQHVKKQLPNVDFIIDGGKTTVGIESTIILLNSYGFEILRYGIITKEEIETVVPYFPEIKDKEKILASGMMKSHYSPSKPLYILGYHTIPYPPEQCGIIYYNYSDYYHFKKHIQLTKNNDLKEYAINMFAAIHEMEEANVDAIVVEPVHEKGIGIAIMDRLKKAAYRYQR